MARTLELRFGFLTSGLHPGDWALLGALVCEWALDLPALERLAAEFPGSFPLPPRRVTVSEWVKARAAEWLASGLCVEAGMVSLSGTRRLSRPEPALGLAPDTRQLVGRHLTRSQALGAIATATRTLLGDRSYSAVSLALLDGDLAAFETASKAVRWIPPGGPTLPAPEHALHEAICSPFDAEWFVATWGSSARALAHVVLADALEQFAPCEELYEWALSQMDATATLGQQLSGGAPLVTLIAHALLRGHCDTAQRLSAALPNQERWSTLAMIDLIHGDLEGAQKALDESVSWDASSPSRRVKRGGLLLGVESLDVTRDSEPDAALRPLNTALGLLLLARDPEDARGDLQRWLKRPSASSAFPARVPRAFRILLQYLTEMDGSLPRLDVHQLPPSTNIWELFVLGLAVRHSSLNEWTRASWSRRLLDVAISSLDAGYVWGGRQLLHLAATLEPSFFSREYAQLDGPNRFGTATPRPGEVVLAEIVEPQPEWAKTLKVLETVSDELEEQTTGALRVAWYVDFAHLSLGKPALQRCAKTGWSEGRRMTFDQLYAKLDELPREDTQVLHSMKFNETGERIASAESFEGLIGHPRVFNGARAGQRVMVVRAECHVSAATERGALVIRVTPPGAQLGVNVIAEGEDQILVYRITANTKRLIDLLPQGLSIPEKHQGQALRVLDKLSQSIDVRSKELGQEVLVDADSTPCLRIAPEAGAWMLQLGVRPFGEKGRFFHPAQGNVTLTHYADGQRKRTERNYELELSRAAELIEACPTLRAETALALEDRNLAETELNDPIHQWVLGEAALLTLLSELRDLSLPCGFEWPDSRAIRVRKAEGGARSLSANLRRRKGWYLLDGAIRLDESTQVDLTDLVGIPATSGRRFVRLPNGDYLELEKRVQRVLAALDQAQIVTGKQKQFKLPESALSALNQLLEEGSGVTADAETHAWVTHRDAVLDREFAPSPHLRADLRSYQVEGFQWLCRLSELGFGACLADDMGLGKTVQIIALLLERLESGPVLVVAPTSVCSNWLKELERFAPGIDAAEYGGTKRTQLLKRSKDDTIVPKTTLLVTSYGLMQQDIEQLAQVSWGCVVLDEAQFIKNAHSQRAKAARKLNAAYRIAATGTPVENHLGDLWSIFQFLNPGLLGTWQAFNRRFVKPIERDKNSIVRSQLKEVVTPFILRRTKSEVLKELPELTEVQHEVRLSEDETKRYTLLRKQISDKLHSTHEKRQNKLEILAELMRLRRFCCHPRLVFPDAALESSKVNDFLTLASELRENGHRALVFSQFVDFLTIVREQLDEHQFSYQYLDGSTPRAQRSAAVDAFQAGVGDLFLISLKAGGFGLNLTAADYVIHLDPWWNPAVEAQATDRAHRIGQERPVTVYRLVTKDTIEQSILRLHREKKAIADALLSDGAEAAQLSTRDLLQLVSGGPSLDSVA